MGLKYGAGLELGVLRRPCQHREGDRYIIFQLPYWLVGTLGGTRNHLKELYKCRAPSGTQPQRGGLQAYNEVTITTSEGVVGPRMRRPGNHEASNKRQ